MLVSIIFPCYNESQNLKHLVKILDSFPLDYPVEFIIVENGSTDNSRQIVQNIKSPRIHKVYIDQNQGYGYGIIQGIKAAKGNYIGWMHSDLQYNPLDLTAFIDYIKNHPNQKCFLKGKRSNRPFLDRFITFNMGILNSIIFKHKMREIMSSPTIAPKTLFKSLTNFPLDFSIDIYIYVLAIQDHLNIVHLPINLKKRQSGYSSWNLGLKSRFKMSKTLLGDSFKIKHNLSKKS